MDEQMDDRNQELPGIAEKKLNSMSEVRRGQAVVIALTERSKVRRQMAEAVGKKDPVSMSLFMEVNDLEIEEVFSAMATLFWEEGVGMGRWTSEEEEADLWSADTERGERTFRSRHVRMILTPVAHFAV